MAYGVKYRLEFSDVLGNGKKIEILKDNYSGSVLPLVGTADPVSIKWEGDDDFYSPIIGSTCTLNLFVTEDVQYDNFYAFDEEEFQVKIYYKNDVNNFILYWAGFIVTDSYKQALMSPPYQISVQANDGLGLLETKFVSIDNNDLFDNTHTNTTTLAQNLITNCISKTNLGLNVYFSTGVRVGNNLTAYVENTTLFGFGSAKYKDNLKVHNCKEYLTNVLRTLNCRIFHALGNWYIVSNSDYMDNDFFEDIFDNTIQQNIRFADTKRLQTELDERPEFRIYNNSGNNVSDIPIDVFIKTKTDLTPIDNDLTVEYIPPAKIVEDNVKQKSLNNFAKIANVDPTFELPTNDWTIVSNRGTIGNFDITTSGEKSFKTTQRTFSTSTFTEMLKSDLFGSPLFGLNDGDKVSFKGVYYFDGSINNSARFNYDIKRRHGATTKYWNADDDTWETTIQKNFIEISNDNEFETFNKSMTMDITVSPYYFEIIIYLPYNASGSSLSGFYIDDLRIEKDSEAFTDVSYSQNRTINSNKIDADYQIVGNPNVTYLRRAQAQGIQTSPIATTQQKINDYRTHLTRYEGTFYNNNKTPVSLRNKIWIDFAKAFVEYVDVTPTPGSVNITYVDGGQEQDRIYTNDSVANIDVDDIVTSSIIPSGTTVLVTQVVTGSPNYVEIDTNLQISVGDVFTITEPPPQQDANRIYTNDSVANISVGDYVTGRNGQDAITTDIQVTQIVTGSPNYVEIDTNLQFTEGEVFAFTEQSFVKFPVSNEYPTHEPVSCMIDSMEYNVKANTVKVVMHVPNQDDDVQATLKQSTQ